MYVCIYIYTDNYNVNVDAIIILRHLYTDPDEYISEDKIPYAYILVENE